MLKKYYNKIRGIFGLSFAMASADFKLRNEGSYLGIFWYLLNPILTFALLFSVFNDRLGSDIKEYPLYLLIGVLMFNFFQNSTIESAKTIVRENIWLIKSINFHTETLVLSIVIKNVFSHFFEIILLAGLIIFLKTNLLMLLFYPIILLFFCIFVYGFSLVLASCSVYFVDLDNIWNFAVRLLWLGTPIFYALGGQIKLYSVNLFNPIYYFITAARDLLIYSAVPDVQIIIGCVFWSFAAISLGIFIFNKLKIKFAEKI